MASLIDRIQTSDAPPIEVVSNCPLCNSAREKFLFWGFDRSNHLPGKFGMVQCEECGLVRLSPRPAKDHLPFYYPEEDYYIYQSPTVSVKNVSARRIGTRMRESIRRVVFDSLGYPGKPLSAYQKVLKPLISRFFLKRATYGWGKRFPRFKKDGLALDVGCGNGTYLSFLKHHGWNVVGVDLSKQAAAVAKKDLDIDVYVGDLEEVGLPTHSFDYVHMSHVLEHVTSPVATLKKVKELLKPNGIVYVEVPNYESLSRKISGEYWFHLDTPRHLHMFSPNTLSRVFRESGLKITRLETATKASFAWDKTYEHEEMVGQKLATRPLVTKWNRAKFFLMAEAAKLIHIFRPKSGDFIYCWGTKEGD